MNTQLNTTLASILKKDAIPFEQVKEEYKPVLGLVKSLIGVSPNSNVLLAIWPATLRTYNLLTPNLLNLPQLLLGNQSFKTMIGLAVYTSSRASGCPYCTVHTCAFAVRNGVNKEAIVGTVDKVGKTKNQSPKEKAVIDFATAMAVVPAKLQKTHIDELHKHFSQKEIELLANAICLTAFWNKFMDALGLELEDEAIEETGKLLSASGWLPGKHVSGDFVVPKKDNAHKINNLTTIFRLAKHIPGAIALENKWLKGVPDNYKLASQFLKENVGYEFPFLANINQSRVIKALTAALKENLNAQNTTLGLPVKCFSAIIFASAIGNKTLLNEFVKMSNSIAPNITKDSIQKAIEIGKSNIEYNQAKLDTEINQLTSNYGWSVQEAVAIVLAKAASPSPAYINGFIVERVESDLLSKQVIELLGWLSLGQLLHRLFVYFDIVKQ